MSTARSCPACGGGDTRPMSNLEANRFYGGDRFVFVKPRVCRTCRAEYEPPTGPTVAFVMVACGGVGVLLGAACVVLVTVMIWYALTADGGTPFTRARMLVLTPLVAAAGVFLIRGGRSVVARYAAARTGSSGATDPTDTNRVS